jgi:hypothetical protein
MKILTISRGVLVLLIACTLTTNTAFAFEHLTNININSTAHPAPLAPETDPATTNAFTLEDGTTLSVARNQNEGVRIWKFSVGDAYWWITDKGIIWGAGTPGIAYTAATEEEAYALYRTMV